MTVVFQINLSNRIKLADEGYAKFISEKFKQALKFNSYLYTKNK